MSTSLIRALRDIIPILTAPETEDLAIQEPGVGWWMKHGAWHRIELPTMTFARLHGISVMAAAQTRQVINPRNPILSTDIFGDYRLQSMFPPTVPPNTIAVTIRRGDRELDDVEDVPQLFDTSRWNQWGKRRERQRAKDSILLELFDGGNLPGFLQALADTRQTGLFAGPTGAGKTRLSKMLGGAISEKERIIAVEDAAELIIRQPNHVRHFYSATGQGVSQAALLKATLRERPDRVMLAEIRDAEAVKVFLEDVGAGHPGSLSTIHGRNAPEAARRLFDLAKQSKAGQATEDRTVARGLGNVIDFIIPVENDGGHRSIGEVWFRPDAERRGETFADLMEQN